MAVYIITYDLHTPGQKYECLTEKIEAYGYYWHTQQSVWVIKTDSSADAIRDNLSTCLDSNDKLFVAKLASEAAWAGLNKESTDWILKFLP